MKRLYGLPLALLFVSLQVLGDLNDVEEQWDAVVSAHVQAGLVNYPALQQDKRFQSVVSAIAEASLDDATPSAHLAFYINAYNALAIDGILQGQSPRTKLGRWRYFYRLKFTVAGERMTLDYLENKLIRAMNEPRIHFAIVCASTSCPALQSAAYRTQTLDQQLDEATKGFINDPSKNRFNVADGSAQVSQIFKWFEEDFVANSGSIVNYIADFVDNPQAAAALRQHTMSTSFLPYDWNLNGRAPKD